MTERAHDSEMAPRRFKLGIYAVAIAIAGCVFYFWHLSSQGYCFGEMRYLTDGELIAGAVRHLKRDISFDGSEQAIQKFYEKNPNCCDVDRKPARRSLLDELTGWNFAEVEVNFERIGRGSMGYRSYVSVSACGEGLKSFGESTKTLEQPFILKK